MCWSACGESVAAPILSAMRLMPQVTFSPSYKMLKFQILIILTPQHSNVKGQSNESFDLQFCFPPFEPAWATDQWLKIFFILIKISLSYSNFLWISPGYHTAQSQSPWGIVVFTNKRSQAQVSTVYLLVLVAGHKYLQYIMFKYTAVRRNHNNELMLHCSTLIRLEDRYMSRCLISLGPVGHCLTVCPVYLSGLSHKLPISSPY